MQTSLGTRHLKMGMWMLNMQFNTDKGLLWSIKSITLKIRIRCFPNLHPIVSFELFGYFVWYIIQIKYRKIRMANSKRKRFYVYCCNAKVKLFTLFWRNWKILESIFVAFPSERRQIQRLFDLECFPISIFTIYILFLSNTHKHS